MLDDQGHLWYHMHHICYTRETATMKGERGRWALSELSNRPTLDIVFNHGGPTTSLTLLCWQLSS